MSFELINESTTFQNFMNDILMKYLNEFVIAYLDDILIYNNFKTEHIKQLCLIFQRLRKADIQIDVDKCEFHAMKIKFLRMIVERDEVRMNLEKIKIIVEWSFLTKLKKVQTFLEFVNFYKRFIKDFFKIAKSLIQLIKKDHLFNWFEKCDTAFNELKKRVIEVLVLSYFSSKLNTFLETNSSDYVSVKVLSQKEQDDIIKSVTFFFKTLFSIECNYEIYDKEMLIIIKCFEQWRAKLQSVKNSINVLTNHKSLKYFMIIKKLNKRQARWAKFRAKFDFKIAYQADKKNDKTDLLIKRSEDRSSSKKNDRHKHMQQILLSSEKLEEEIASLSINDLKSDNELTLFDAMK